MDTDEGQGLNSVNQYLMYSLIFPLFLSMMVSLSTLYLAPMWSTVNGGLPLLALPFFRVVYVDTDGNHSTMSSMFPKRFLIG